MLRDGNYAVWFTTSGNSGTGQIRLDGGKLSGGDTVINYVGTYENEGECFRATITTNRHGAGQALLGSDEVTIRFSGRCAGLLAAGSGSIDQLPGVEIAITLMPITDESPRLPVEYTQIAPRPMSPLPPETGSRYRPHRKR